MHDRSSFFKYVSPETAKSVLRNRTLRWSSPHEFNDLLDVPKELNLGFSIPDLGREIAQTIIECVETGENPTGPAGIVVHALRAETDANRRNEMIQSLLDAYRGSQATPETLLKEFSANWRDMVADMRILCLSETPDSMPMWAHYAEQHRGVVFRFECLDKIDSATLIARPVTYQSDSPKLPPIRYWARTALGLDVVDWNYFFKEYRYVKHESWSNEKEWRVVSAARPREGPRFADIQFDPTELSGMFIGARASAADIKEFLSLSSNFPRVEVFQSAIDTRENRMSFSKIRDAAT